MLSAGGDMLCLYVRPVDGNRHVWVNLSTARTGEKPELYVSELSGTCLSYGIGTVFEFKDSEATRPSRLRGEASAAIDGEARLLRCDAKSGHFFSDVFINLDQLQEDHSDGAAPAPVDTWCIWATEEDMTNPRSQPIFEARPTQSAQ